MSPYGRVEMERRVFPRFRLEIPVQYERELQGPHQTARAGDASRGGLRLFLDEALAPGEVLRLAMHLSDPKAPRWLRVTARVVWCAQSPEATPEAFTAGLEFMDVDPADRKLFDQFERLWLEQGN